MHPRPVIEVLMIRHVGVSIAERIPDELADHVLRPVANSRFKRPNYLPMKVAGGSLEFSKLAVWRCEGGQQALDSARHWVAWFVDWYNRSHRHSAIQYVAPDHLVRSQAHE